MKTINPKLYEERLAAKPRPYHPSQKTFLCFCRIKHEATDGIIQCECGRRWRKLDADPTPE